MSSDKFKAVAPEMMFGIADTIAHHRGLVQFFLQLLGKIRVQDENKITLGEGTTVVVKIPAICYAP
jgi:hypothetical protein